MPVEHYRIKVKGIVQGVGFRPFIHGLAESLFLCGRVANTGDGVIIEAEGEREVLEQFLLKIRKEAPFLAVVSELEVEKLPLHGYTDFKIERSEPGSGRNTNISPDAAVCSDCVAELFNKSDRRYLYPFINCTNCGPRFTIIKDVPYDRPNTTMASFEMCEDCRKQYEDPGDRRFHAQPVACAHCGPRLCVVDSSGKAVDTAYDSPAEFTCRQLALGRIIAVKGIGGYHLSCDAYNNDAIMELRKRKRRDERPFAVMVKDLETAAEHCFINKEEEALLRSPASPIVLLRKKMDCRLPDSIAPGNPYLGVMLSYTPVHHLLFAACNKQPGGHIVPDTLVMTSGNISNEPICYTDDEALKQLGGVADYFLLNNREIFVRNDDSVTRVFNRRKYIIRRSRGYVPRPVTVEAAGASFRSVLACGGELKNTFCLSKNNDFYLSHHIGDLENLQTLKSFEDGIEHFKRLFDIKPEIMAFDLHPRYLSTRYALECDFAEKLAVQHHHAHIAACMAENGLNGDVIGVAFDGTGYGEDGKLWGGEFFYGTYGNFTRYAHLGYVRMPGGEAAIMEPLRMIPGYLHGKGMDVFEAFELMAERYNDRIASRLKDPTNVNVLNNLIDRGLNSPFTSSMGRLFDAVSAAAGIRCVSSYEGQAAMELEYAALPGYYGAYGYSVNNMDGVYEIDASGIILEVLEDVRNNVPAGVISSKFHDTVTDMVVNISGRIRALTGNERVVLSGGVFQNMLLLAKCCERLERQGFSVFTHSRVPANDGGISLGQAVTAAVVLSGK